MAKLSLKEYIEKNRDRLEYGYEIYCDDYCYEHKINPISAKEYCKLQYKLETGQFRTVPKGNTSGNKFLATVIREEGKP